MPYQNNRVFDKPLRFIVLEDIQMDEIGNSASEEMPELTETFENKNNNKIPEESFDRSR
jgi:hypothetical protein